MYVQIDKNEELYQILSKDTFGVVLFLQHNNHDLDTWFMHNCSI